MYLHLKWIQILYVNYIPIKLKGKKSLFITYIKNVPLLNKLLPWVNQKKRLLQYTFQYQNNFNWLYTVNYEEKLCAHNYFENDRWLFLDYKPHEARGLCRSCLTFPFAILARVSISCQLKDETRFYIMCHITYEEYGSGKTAFFK